ncbi:cobalamin-binding protein [Frankia sp. AgB1.9]|uniref:helical backbone metal receptor n=1 Tax=unclassified Frankia TaxID=2632575 RepID=UPI0027DB4F67|nr:MULTISPECIES: helical backbone metal receptor [unclassified Frankia]MBL7494549.1 cobalamin-binding protein [Frankia sp. AgW1.1]MBL7552927.1 cobalamin-binding protein [Frankia sp. AgB1.9]
MTASDDLVRDDSVRDDLGLAVRVPRRVERVVSLVPSLTESIAVSAPGLLVAATDWCTHPGDLDVTRIRGTKNPDVETIVRLGPDLVVANAEENREPDLAALRAAGLAVWVTAPTTVPAALASLDRMLVAACRLPRPGWLDEAVTAWREQPAGPRRRAVIPIWRRPWMAVGRDTFTGDVLARLGVDNVLAGHAERYPRITIADLPAHDLVVLPDEPYAFSPTDGPEAFTAPSVCVSGRHLTWYGPSLAEARAVLRGRFETAL